MSTADLTDAQALTSPAERSVRRVCLVTEAAGGGVGRHFLDLAAGLAARGIEVAAVYSPVRCDAQFHQRQAKLSSVQFVPLTLRRAVQPGDLLDLWKLLRCLRSLGPFDMIHGHSSKGGALARLAGWQLKTPTLYTPHAFVTLDPTLSSWKRTVYGRIEGRLGKLSAAVITVSPDEAIHARELGIDARRTHVIPNGIEPPDFPLREVVRQNLGLAADELAIGFVGRLEPQKAPGVLIDAFARLVTEIPRAKLVMVGSGSLEFQLRQQAAMAGVDSQVLFLGDCIGTQIMPAFDVFCLPSRYEGMTYVLLEALAAGLPIVATRVGGVALCVEEGVNGFIVTPNDAAQFAAVLARLVSDRDSLTQYSEASRKRSCEFTAARMVDATLDLYKACLAH